MKFAIAALLGFVAVQAVTVTDYFTPHDHEAHYYERVTTPRFSQDGDDIFMRSMIEQYALEEKTKVVEHDDGTKSGGEPTGKFWMDFNTSKAAASEVLGTHKGLSGAALKEYLATYFPRTFAHYDVNKSGKLGVEVMPQFMRFVSSDQTLNLQ